MTSIRISEAGKYEKEYVSIQGWLYNQRSSGKIKFMIIRDGSGFLQGTLIKNEVEEKYFYLLDELNYESSIVVEESCPKAFPVLRLLSEIFQPLQKTWKKKRA